MLVLVSASNFYACSSVGLVTKNAERVLHRADKEYRLNTIVWQSNEASSR